MRRVRRRRWGALASVAVAVWLLSAAARPDAGPPPPLVVEVAYGDSLWTLARRYGDPAQDVREVVTAMMRANSIAPGRLQPGQRLLIPSAYVSGNGMAR